jgi:hypothetical protein
MSIRLMSLVWEVTWPTQSQLLVALKLADHANDDGTHVYPAKASIARLAQCSESTVQNALRAFRDCGLLEVVRPGGQGPRDPTVYAINIHLLTLLANAKSTLLGGADRISIPEEIAEKVVHTKGSTVDPLLSTRGQSEGSKGSKALTPNHHLEPSREPSLAREENILNGSEVKRAEPQFAITYAAASWPDWLKTMTAEQVERAMASGVIVTTAKWPSNGRLLHIQPAGLTERSKAILGS